MNWNDILEMMKTVNSLLGGLSGIFVLVVGGAKLFGKNLLSYWFNKDLEKYKAELDAKNKNIQNQLDIKLQLLNMRESKLLIERSESMNEVYGSLLMLQTAIQVLNAPFRPIGWGSDDELLENAMKISLEFQQKWLKCKLFFPKELADNIDIFAKKCLTNANQNIFTKRVIQTNKDFLKKELDKLRKEAESELPIILRSVESSFREIIGVEIRIKD